MILHKPVSPIMPKISASGLYSLLPFCIHHCRIRWRWNKVQTARTNILAVISLLSQLNIFISILWSAFLYCISIVSKNKNLKGIKERCLLTLISKEMWVQTCYLFDKFETRMLMKRNFILIFLPTKWISHAHHIFPHFCILNSVSTWGDQRVSDESEEL